MNPIIAFVTGITAGGGAYSPRVIKASANKAYKLEITSKDNWGCGRAFTIPSEEGLERSALLLFYLIRHGVNKVGYAGVVDGCFERAHISYNIKGSSKAVTSA